MFTADVKHNNKMSNLKLSHIQRAKLEDEFDDLIKGASADIQDAYKSELEQHDLVDSGLDVEDEKLILADYNSDDNNNDSDNEEVEESPDHCTKVCITVTEALI